jgi:hypothetical protein
VNSGGRASRGEERKWSRKHDLKSWTPGSRPVIDGWFVVNVRDAARETNDQLGAIATAPNIRVIGATRKSLLPRGRPF